MNEPNKEEIKEAIRFNGVEPPFSIMDPDGDAENYIVESKHRAVLIAAYKEAIETLQDMAVALQAAALPLPDWFIEVVNKYPEGEI